MFNVLSHLSKFREALGGSGLTNRFNTDASKKFSSQIVQIFKSSSNVLGKYMLRNSLF